MTGFLPFARPCIDDAMVADVADTLRSRWIATGPRVAAFEKALSDYVGGRPVRTLTSATAAMQVALEPHVVGGVACYVVSLVVWLIGLSRVEVSIAYPMLSIGYVVNALAAWYLFGESLTAQKLVGIGFIVVGVVLVGRS